MNVVRATRVEAHHTYLLYMFLLPVRPPSLTYWGLGVMLEPYALDVV